jgi:hypothetical protein
MLSTIKPTIASLIALLSIAFANPLPANDLVARQSLKSPYTITVYAPGDYEYNGAKINNFNVFQTKVASYCPLTGSQASSCPNGTDMAFVGTLSPVSCLYALTSKY